MNRRRPPPYEEIMEKANSLLMDDETEKALAEYEKAIKLDPGRERGYCGAALASAIMKKDSDAYARMDELLRAVPGAAYAHGFVGYIMERRGEYDGALAAYDRLLESDPDDVAAIVQKYRALSLAGRKKEGSECIDRAFKIAPAGEVVAKLQDAALSIIGLDDRKAGDYSGLPPGPRQVMEIVFLGAAQGRARALERRPAEPDGMDGPGEGGAPRGGAGPGRPAGRTRPARVGRVRAGRRR